MLLNECSLDHKKLVVYCLPCKEYMSLTPNADVQKKVRSDASMLSTTTLIAHDLCGRGHKVSITIELRQDAKKDPRETGWLEFSDRPIHDTTYYETDIIEGALDILRKRGREGWTREHDVLTTCGKSISASRALNGLQDIAKFSVIGALQYSRLLLGKETTPIVNYHRALYRVGQAVTWGKYGGPIDHTKLNAKSLRSWNDHVNTGYSDVLTALESGYELANKMLVRTR